MSDFSVQKKQDKVEIGVFGRMGELVKIGGGLANRPFFKSNKIRLLVFEIKITKL